MELNAIQSVPASTGESSVREQDTSSFPARFQEHLGAALEGVNTVQVEADELARDFALGQTEHSLHDVIIAAEKADLSLQLAVQSRNRIVDAYQEVMRMQI